MDVQVALPGGFGTFEEVLEAVTWTRALVSLAADNSLTVPSQSSASVRGPILAKTRRKLIRSADRKPVVLLNVCGLFSPLRDLISGAVDAGFIPAANAGFVVFVDPDASPDADWGTRALRAGDDWYKAEGGMGGGKSYALDWKKA